jgi:large subunit ribosomal protein L30e
MIDMNRQIGIAVKTGRVVFGSQETVGAARSGRSKLIIIASNCPEPHRSSITHNAKLANIPVYVYPGDSLTLGRVCEKPFLVAAMAVIDPGDSDILKLAEVNVKHED